jgi:hypothetical protein
MKPGYGLIDGEKRNAEHPDTFEIPSAEDRADLEVGTYAKIGVEGEDGMPGERFWVLVQENAGGRFKGEINNDLVYTDLHGLSGGDTIEFGPEHVLTLEPPKPGITH